MNDYDINSWARDQRAAETDAQLWRMIIYFVQKFPRTSKVIGVVSAIATFVALIINPIDPDLKPLGILLSSLALSAIAGTLAYLFGALILIVFIIAIIVNLIKPYL